MRNYYLWLFISLTIALIIRIYIFLNRPPIISCDSFVYLNIARFLRNENVAPIMDNIANIPRNETLGRPVYPLFLNLVFTIARWSPTPNNVVEQLKRQEPKLNDNWHLRFLKTKENLKAVQAFQHLLGLIATVLTFLLLWEWTRTGWLAMLGSLIAVGCRWRLGWLGFERCILTEPLAAFLVLNTIFFLNQTYKYRWSLIWMLITLVISYLLALTRTNFLFLPPLLLIYFIWCLSKQFRQFHWLNKIVIILIPLITIVGCWKVYYSISAYHFALIPEAFEDPILRQTLQEYLSHNPNDRDAIYYIIPELMKKWNTSWTETHKQLINETHKALWNYPGVFLKSTLKGLGDYFTYGGLSGEIKLGTIRGIIALGLILFNTLGLFAFLLKNSPSILKFALFITLLNALVCSIVIGVNAGQSRYSFPTETILNLAAFWVVWHLMQLMRTKLSQTPAIQ
jgi:hypothetical protein